ncbi:hypothetical protein FRC07_007609, partial [Ceratobasidium sp. 392]
AALRAKSCTYTSSPPSVPGHWLFKNQKQLEAPWRGVLLADKYKPQYGDIFQLSTPFKTVVVLNSLQAVYEVLKKQSAVTSDRPRNVMLFEMCGFGRTVGFRNHDELQRKCRRVMASCLHPAAARSYADLHTAASAFFLRDLVDRLSALSSTNHLVIEPNHSVPMAASIRDAIGRFIMRMTYGHVVVENDPLLAMVKRQSELLLTGFAKHYWVNNIPILRCIPKWFPGAGFVRDAAYCREQRAIVAREPFAAVLADVNQGTVERPSYSSKLLEQKGGANASEEDIDLVKWTAQPMFAAGPTTVSGFEVSALIAESDSGLQTVALVHSFLFTMCIRPEIAARVQAKIDAQVGRDRFPTLHDRDSLPFTDAVLQEVIRCNPIFAFGLEHCASEDLQVRGYTIKKGTTIEANIWALMREPSTYPDPHTFNPDCFLKKVPDTDPRRFLFGFGRRVCPGQHVANNGAFTMCASFMSVFIITAGEDTMREVAHCGRDLWKMFTPFGPFEPKPFACTIRPRDQAALAILEACKETKIIN